MIFSILMTTSSTKLAAATERSSVIVLSVCLFLLFKAVPNSMLVISFKIGVRPSLVVVPT